jgi:DNA-binding NarL/FixJ family response regulator
MVMGVMQTDEIRAAVVDDHPLYRLGIRTLLANDLRLTVVIDVGSPEEALEQAQHQPIDLAILDLVLPGMSGVTLATRLHRMQPECKIVGLSMSDDTARIAELLRAGASGFVHKSQGPEAILEAVRLVLGGVRYLPANVSRDQIDELERTQNTHSLDHLTKREREIFELLVTGSSNDDIATKLFIARRTVETHRTHVMHKLAARSIVDLVRIAHRHGVGL